ncbi:ABC-2 type transport system ATP-binding protein [Variovorax boronicumulans]|uniref:ATP-binding cassette domain-containing protein n=1 Tax=Variovorax boronicumulans TaxID=436515 RepID=UPI002781D61E|nr:ATP-binding cassette domain-containing protein [Variovorax boronicumulans]MDQ0012496.1 ABC-2 type transport system ATP-binding protein [Variovorax boronicumulans]
MAGIEPAVAGRSLHKRFTLKSSKQPVHALDGVSLDIPAGTLTALVGPDGAGKTTLLRLMAGLMRADEGELRVLGIDVSADPQAVQDRISYMPQRFGLYDDLSVQENLDLYADLHGVSNEKRRERYARLMEMTDLGRFTDRPAGKLSGGMKQKLGLACTLVRSPDLLLLDEPTVGVDPLSRRELWQIVQQLVEDEKLSVIVSTAYLDEAERCSHVFVLREGKLLAEGAPAEIRDHAKGLCFVSAPPDGEPPRLMQARLLDARQNIVDAVPQGGEVHFIRRPDTDDAALAALLAGAHAEPVPPRLEDGFMTLLRTQQASAPNHTAVATPASAKGDPDEVVIEVKDLVRRFGDFVAVASTSFSVRRGEIFGLLGPNGAGKTTTFRMLCGLLPASGGQLRVAGVDLRHARAQARQRIGYVSQKFALYGNLTVRENLSFFGGAYGLRGQRLQSRMQIVLRQFDLERELDTPSGQLPGGYRQRLAMATGLLHEPEILFLDEPTSGADPLARREFWRRITALAEGGTTIVITTHFMEEAEYCDRIVIQDAGKVLAIGTPQEVRTQALDGQDSGKRIDMEQAFIGIVEKARRKGQEATAKQPEGAAA